MKPIATFLLLGLLVACAGGNTTTSDALPSSGDPDAGAAHEAGTPPSADAGSQKDAAVAPPAHDTKFAFTIDGTTMTADGGVVVERHPGTNLTTPYLTIIAKFRGTPNGSDSSLTISVLESDTEGGVCEDTYEPDRSVSFFFKDDDGSFRGLATQQLNGTCSMTIASGIGEKFTSGSASGILGGTTTKSFSVTWGQAIP
jgi:hypothetical protein